MLWRIMNNPTIIARRLLLAFLIWMAGGWLLAPACGAQEPLQPLVVMVSIDGLRPDYITAADAHGAKVPNLRRFLKEGAYAEGVQGVVPTVTYPSHTTLVTGVWPSKHGIYANETFDPLQRNYQGWYWYAEDVHAPTLWSAASAAGRVTASVNWPVTVGAHIDWNIPEFWRAGTPDDGKLLRVLATPGMLAKLESGLGPYPAGIDESPEADERREQFAAALLEEKKPDLLTVHVIALDGAEHETGPFSPQAIAVLERLDAVIGRLRAVAERVAPGRTYFAVVSDHGFAPEGKQLNLLSAFREAGLITVANGKITDWKAMPWETGGSAAIVLKNPADTETQSKVRELLAKIAADPANGVDRVLNADELHERGGFPTASFIVGLKPGWKTGHSLEAPLLTKVKPGGTHGHLPDLPELRSSFFVVGPGIPAGRDLGVIDMRDIAPTLAHLGGYALSSADGKILLP